MAARRLLTTILLPQRATPAERIATLDADVRAAADEAKVKITQHAQRFTNTGWTLDDESWEMAVVEPTPGERAILVSARVTRHD